MFSRFGQTVSLKLMFSLAIAGCVLTGCGGMNSSTLEYGAEQKTAGTVRLEIDFNSDRKPISVAIPCSSDSTVFSILERARNLGDLKFRSTGTGDLAFVNSIGGVKNQPASNNWVYRVNGKLADKSSGAYAVKPGDQIQWVFGTYP